MTTSVIIKSQLEGALRLDAEYYQPEYLEIARTLQSVPHETLEDAAENLVSFGAYALTNFIEWRESGIPLITAENIRDGFVDYKSARFIDEKVDEILKKSRVKENQVLLAMSGSVGNAAVAVDIPQRLNSNQDIVKITPRAGLSPYVLAAFLNSRYGKKQVLRLPVGSVQQHIFLWQMQTMLIPLFDAVHASAIENSYKGGLGKLNRSESLYSQAENALLEELGLKDVEIKDDLSYIVNLSETNDPQRVDAEYFQPKYSELLKRIEKYSLKPLPEVIQVVNPTFVPQAQSERTFRYVELADIDSSIGIVDGFSEVLGKEAPSRARRILKTGDVIVSSVEGSLEKVAIVDRDHDECLASTGFFQFRSKDILPEVLLVLAKSIVLQMQLEKQTTGTILSAAPRESLKRVYIPEIPKQVQEKIADLVRQSHESRRKAKQLFEEAKRKVEEMIEKGEHYGKEKKSRS